MDVLVDVDLERGLLVRPGRDVVIELGPEADEQRYCRALVDNGLLCKETSKGVLRIAPPLNIGPDDLDLGYQRIAKVLEP